jgi:hypothetical protein
MSKSRRSGAFLDFIELDQVTLDLWPVGLSDGGMRSDRAEAYTRLGRNLGAREEQELDQGFIDREAKLKG